MAFNHPVPSPLPAQAVAHNNYGAAQVPGTIFPSATRAAATYTSDAIHNPNALGVRLYVNVTDDGASGTVTVELQTKDPVSDTWLRIAGAVTAALTDTAVPSTLIVYPGVTAAANLAVSQPVGTTWRVVAVVATNDVVFSVGAEHLL